MTPKSALTLASASPRRQQLLALGGWTYDVQPADVDERPLNGEPPGDYVLRVAESKARAVGASTPPDAIIIAADTAVVDGGDILGKPNGPAEAESMLRRLRGGAHQVFTGLAVFRPDENLTLTDLAVSEVPMRSYGDDEIEAYIATGDPFDKAGAYAIQHPQFHPVENLASCYANVVGLPLCHLVRTLAQLEVNPSADVPQGCQNTLRYQCPIYEQVLRGDL